MESKATILICEDDRNIGFYLRKKLELLDYSVCGVYPTGEEALSQLESLRPDLILMDIMLEGKLDGIDTAIIIKDKYRIPVVFVTALSNERSIQRAKLADPYGYLFKPFENKDLIVAIEIALHKRELDRKLMESELWFRATLGSIGDAVIATDKNNNVKFTNAVFEKLSGYSSNECLGKPLEEVYKSHIDISTESLLSHSNQRLDQSLEPLLHSKIFESRDGHQTPVEENISTIYDSEKKEIGKVISLRDVTQRRDAQLKAFSAREHYLTFFEKFPHLIWRTNHDGHFNYFNPAWLDFVGRNVESLIYKGWIQCVHPDDQKLFEEAFEKSIAKKERLLLEFRIQANDAEYHWVMCTANPYNDLNGNFTGYIGLCLDITNRKTLETELRSSKEVADASNRAKSTFISNMSHEIRTPLNGVIGLTDLLIDTKLDEEQQEYLEMIKQSAYTLLGLLNNLLDYSKIEDNKITINEGEFNLRKNLNEIIMPYQTQAKRTGVKLSFIIDDEVPELLIGDEMKIKQIISNLLSNSVKFTERGSISLLVGIENSLRKRSITEERILLHFVVSDTGIGIPKEKQEMIFDSFTQVDNSMTRKYSGSGLGLSIVKKIVEMLKGKIWIESEFGKGTDFHFVCELKRKIIEKELTVIN